MVVRVTKSFLSHKSFIIFIPDIIYYTVDTLIKDDVGYLTLSIINLRHLP